jgi:hypothetical protein
MFLAFSVLPNLQIIVEMISDGTVAFAPPCLQPSSVGKEMRRFNKRVKELDAEDAQRRGGFLTKVVRFFSSKHGTR